MSSSQVKVEVIFQRAHEVYDFLLVVAGSDSPSLMASSFCFEFNLDR